MRANARERLAEGASRAGDQDRTSGSRRAAWEHVVPRPRMGAARALPPARQVEHGVIDRLAPTELRCRFRKQGWTRNFRARVKAADIISALAPGQQRTPVHHSEYRPQGHRAQVDAFSPRRFGFRPDLVQPPHLLVARAAMVHFGDDDRDIVAVPRFLQAEARAELLGQLGDANRLNVDVSLMSVRAGLNVGETFDTVIEVALARQIMVEADQVRRCGAGGQLREHFLRSGLVPQPAIKRVSGHHAAGEQVERQPAPVILVIRLMLKGIGCERLPDVFRGQQFRVGDDLTDRFDRTLDRQALVDQRAERRVDVGEVRMPMAVQAGESSRGHRLVHGVPIVDPGIASRDLGRIVREQVGKLRIEQTGVPRARAMVHERGDHLDPALAEVFEPLVVPRKVELSRRLGRDRFPQDRIADRFDAETDHRVEVVEAGGVPGFDDLVTIFVADANDRTFDPAPQLQRWSGGHYSAATAVGCGRSLVLFSSMRRKVASACPTIWSML